ncbi:MAG: class I SAM-dependent methyltransferase [Spirochaetes bacterium]|nr:class I SAM-dependent methyltransferase [Spirochaetota bacterium]
MNGSILLIPSIRRKGGLGHLVRMMRLALSWKGNASILLEPGNPLHWKEEEVRSFFPAFPWDRFLERKPDSRPWDWVIFDRKSTSLEEYGRLHFGAPTLGLDEGGEARLVCTYLLDTFPRIRKSWEPNKREPLFAPMIDFSLERRYSDSYRPFLLAFGGEDPYRLSERSFDGLVSSGVRPEEIDVLLGPARSHPFQKPCGNILSGGWDSRKHFSRYRWVVTSFGLTPYEAILEGSTPLLVNPTQYHEDLSKRAGFYSLGVRRVSRSRLRFALEHPELVLPIWVKGWRMVSGNKASFGEFLSTIQADILPQCPLCKGLENRVFYRVYDRSFFRCGECRTEYRVYFGGQKKEYTSEYFFEEYRRQYGKTYVEDFSKIKEQGKKRLAFLTKGLSARGLGSLKGKTVLDVGCALGPFLDAAREEGMIPYGIDLSEDAIRYVREKLGIPAMVADIETFDPLVSFGVRAFDVISLWYVIEHLPKLGLVLERVRDMLSEGGWLIFSTPNGKGISSLRNPRSFREQSPIDHVTIWNVAQAKNVLPKFGFRVFAVRTPSHHPERFPSLVRVLIGSKGCRAMETLFHLGDTFEVYAQKIDHDSRGRTSSDSRP